MRICVWQFLFSEWKSDLKITCIYKKGFSVVTCWKFEMFGPVRTFINLFRFDIWRKNALILNIHGNHNISLKWNSLRSEYRFSWKFTVFGFKYYPNMSVFVNVGLDMRSNWSAIVQYMVRNFKFSTRPKDQTKIRIFYCVFERVRGIGKAIWILCGDWCKKFRFGFFFDIGDWFGMWSLKEPIYIANEFYMFIHGTNIIMGS